MPGLVLSSEPRSFDVKELHPTFGAEIRGLDLSKDVSDELFQEILGAMTKYGVCVFRDTKLDDTSHVDFSRRFGELDDVKPYMKGDRKLRYQYYELFDAGNIDDDGGVLGIDSARSHYSKGNTLWHVDSSFNPRRASYSLLRAHILPPPGNGGNTEFADTRTAFETLPEDLKTELLAKNYIGVHSLHHSRKTGSPEFFKDLNPEDFKMHRHLLAQTHEPSGRMNLYIAAHMHHIEGLSTDDSQKLTDTLMGWATRPENTLSIGWGSPGDLIIWDNTAVMHRAAGGAYEGRFKRDLRRTTVHDASSTAWGKNEKIDSRPGFIPGLDK
ncbi:taurine catabolism dioxygenase [Xylariomycetidae sp. FL2044]|nr:taurine catabolism dioxygenase [Xylariomycetidae sp. FL2044]